jgi:hypothetical protein
VSFTKIPIFSAHWTSLFTPDTVGLMTRALFAFVFILASAFRHRQGLALENRELSARRAPYLTDQVWNPSTTPNVADETKAKIVDDLTRYALTF